MKQNNNQRTAVKVMDIIGEVLPEENFTPNKCHRLIKIAGGRGVKWPRGLRKRLYLFGVNHEIREKLLPGEMFHITQVREIKDGKYHCLAVTKITKISILPALEHKTTCSSPTSTSLETAK